MKNYFFKICIKSIILIVIIYFIVQIIFFSSNISVNKIDKDFSSPSKFSVIVMPLDKFFNYLNKSEYDKAFNLLTDENKKNLFQNDVNNFAKIMKEKYINKEIVSKRQNYIFKNEEKKDDNEIIYKFVCKIYSVEIKDYNNSFYHNKYLGVNIYEYSPFNYKLELDFDLGREEN